MNRHLPANVVSDLKTWASAQPEIARMYAFGRRVRGWTKLGCCVRPDSDIDLAVALGRSVEDAALFWMDETHQWRRDLAGLVPYVVDLHLLDAASKTIQQYVDHSGVMIFSRVK